MSEFELSRNLAFGQYFPGDSPLHRLDARVKLLGAALLMLTLMFQQGPALTLLGVLLVLLLFWLARAPLHFALRGLRPLLPLLLFALLLQLLFYPHRQAIAEGSLALLEWGPVLLSGAALAALAALVLRMISIVLLLTLLGACADVTDLTHGMQGLLRPLQRLGLPAHEFSMVLVIALRFVPLLVRELERLMKAQAARGADFGRGRGGIVRRVSKIMPLIIPLFVTALRRAEDLAVAMEARGYAGGRGRSHLVCLHMRPADGLALFLVCAACAGLWFVDLGALEEIAATWLRGLWIV
ncbi:MAG: energy-coupling factor transporter transmembrane protein EcfT [Chloroflexia bacterium]|nr:energy-coupling factor transporter transmembrane protein EcfT [Chloroflexia bacterium]